MDLGYRGWQSTTVGRLAGSPAFVKKVFWESSHSLLCPHCLWLLSSPSSRAEQLRRSRQPTQPNVLTLWSWGGSLPPLPGVNQWQARLSWSTGILRKEGACLCHSVKAGPLGPRHRLPFSLLVPTVEFPWCLPAFSAVRTGMSCEIPGVRVSHTSDFHHPGSFSGDSGHNTGSGLPALTTRDAHPREKGTVYSVLRAVSPWEGPCCPCTA